MSMQTFICPPCPNRVCSHLDRDLRLSMVDGSLRGWISQARERLVKQSGMSSTRLGTAEAWLFHTHGCNSEKDHQQKDWQSILLGYRWFEKNSVPPLFVDPYAHACRFNVKITRNKIWNKSLFKTWKLNLNETKQKRSACRNMVKCFPGPGVTHQHLEKPFVVYIRDWHLVLRGARKWLKLTIHGMFSKPFLAVHGVRLA